MAEEERWLEYLHIWHMFHSQSGHVPSLPIRKKEGHQWLIRAALVSKGHGLTKEDTAVPSKQGGWKEANRLILPFLHPVCSSYLVSDHFLNSDFIIMSFIICIQFFSCSLVLLEEIFSNFPQRAAWSGTCLPLQFRITMLLFGNGLLSGLEFICSPLCSCM